MSQEFLVNILKVFGNRPNYIPPIMNLRFLIKETKRDFFVKNTPVMRDIKGKKVY